MFAGYITAYNTCWPAFNGFECANVHVNMQMHMCMCNAVGEWLSINISSPCAMLLTQSDVFSGLLQL